MRGLILLPFFSILNLLTFIKRASTKAIRRRPNPETVPKQYHPLSPSSKGGTAIRRAPSPKLAPKNSKPYNPTRGPKKPPKGNQPHRTNTTPKAKRRRPNPKTIPKRPHHLQFSSSTHSPNRRSFPSTKNQQASKRQPNRHSLIVPASKSKVKNDINEKRHRHGSVSVAQNIPLHDEDEIYVQLFDIKPSRRYKKITSFHKPRDSISFYYGESSDDEPYSTINLLQLTTPDGQQVIVGTVNENGSVYNIQQLPNGDVAVKSTHSGDFQPERHHHGKPDKPERYIQHDDVEGVIYATNSSTSSTGRRLSDDGSVLDVMVIYTNNAMCAAAQQSYGCPANSVNKAIMEALINLAVQETNIAFKYSNIPTQLRLVHTHYDAIFDDHSYDWPSTLRILHDANDGILDYVPAMRRQYGADFVSMFIDASQYCGLSYLPSQPNADAAFSLVSWSCATGYFSFGHELGHNMGCNHDRADAGDGGMNTSTWNFGYQYLKGRSHLQNFRTILSYDCPGGCVRLQRYSNPTEQYQGLAVGAANANNARWIRDRLATYANFMPTVASLPSKLLHAGMAANKSQAVGSHSIPGIEDVLSTTFSGGLIGVAGNIFSVVAKNDLTITNFAVNAYAATTVTVEVWKRLTKGGCKGFQRRRNAWEQIGVVSFVSSAAGHPSVLPFGSIPAVPLKAGDEQCFYLTFSGDTNYNRYSKGRRFGRTYKQNDDMQITEGYAVAYEFSGSLRPRVFNGEVHYRLGMGTTSTPTAAPTMYGGDNGPDSSSLHAIATTFEGGSGQAGNMFDVEALKAITVKAFDVHTMSRSIQEIQIYTKRGSFVGFENNASAWRLICSHQVKGKGSPNPTHIPESVVTPVTIEVGEMQAFYVSFTKTIIRYTEGHITAMNDEISFIRSTGIKYPFADIYPERIWNGKLYYGINSNAR